MTTARSGAKIVRRALCLMAMIALPAICASEERSSHNPPPGIGDPHAGATAITALGCGTCHSIPGIEGASGVVGPPLARMGKRVFIAGMLRNTQDNMVSWLLDPQAVVPGNVMPNMKLTQQQALDIAAYLATLE